MMQSIPYTSAVAFAIQSVKAKSLPNFNLSKICIFLTAAHFLHITGRDAFAMKKEKVFLVKLCYGFYFPFSEICDPFWEKAKWNVSEMVLYKWFYYYYYCVGMRDIHVEVKLQTHCLLFMSMLTELIRHQTVFAPFCIFGSRCMAGSWMWMWLCC